jgi:hypothetical protein
MLLTGLWHGAGIQFLIFGALHGIYLTANQAWRHFRTRSSGPPAPPASPARIGMMVGVYLQVAFALVFFRSESLHSAFALLGDVAGRHGIGPAAAWMDGIFAFALFPVVWFFPNTQQILGQESTPAVAMAGHRTPMSDPRDPAAPTLRFARFRWSPNMRWAFLMAILFFAVLANLDRTTSFLYFQF